MLRKRLFFLKNRSHDRHTPVALAIVILIVCVSLIGYYYFTTMRPLLEKYVETAVRNRISLMINRTIEEEIAANAVTYDSLIHITTDSQGQIMSLTTDIGAMNTLKAKIESKIIERITETEMFTIAVPIGSLMGGEFLSGRGPCLRIKVVPIAEVYAEYDNDFASAGINQTRHQLYMTYNVRLSVLLPGWRKGTTVTSSVCVAETIIVGTTPQFFAGGHN